MDAIGCAWGVHLVSLSIFRWLISICYFHDSFLLLLSYLLNLPCFKHNKICSHFILLTISSSSQQMLIFLLFLSHTIQWKKSLQCLNLVLQNISIYVVLWQFSSKEFLSFKPGFQHRKLLPLFLGSPSPHRQQMLIFLLCPRRTI